MGWCRFACSAVIVHGPVRCVPRMFESARSSVLRLQHSPSRVTNPEGLQVQHDLEFQECLHEDVHGHFFSGAVLDFDVRVGDGLADDDWNRMLICFVCVW